jgi:succinate dehydrogenase/fumarate reductase flavoprotein subunit
MSSHYAIIQYVPRPIANERINIGVIVVGEGGCRVQFLRNWDRVKAFGGEDIGFLLEFAERFFDVEIPVTIDWISRAVVNWQNSIQIEHGGASLDGIDELLGDVVEKYLVEPK